MTDLDRWKVLLNDMGVEFEIETSDAARGVHPLTILKMSEGAEKVDGYPMFFVTVVFTSSGKFVSIGAWE